MIKKIILIIKDITKNLYSNLHNLYLWKKITIVIFEFRRDYHFSIPRADIKKNVKQNISTKCFIYLQIYKNIEIHRVKCKLNNSLKHET